VGGSWSNRRCPLLQLRALHPTVHGVGV